MNANRSARTAAVAAISALAVAASGVVAVAQPYGAPPPGYGQGYGPPPPPNGGDDQGYNQGPPNGGYDQPPPNGQYPSPPGAGPSYDQQAYYADQQYAAQYQAWAARYCVQQHNNNVAAGALIGGALGAILGGGIGGHAGGAALGGVLGAGTGAAIASTAPAGPPGGCPPGYIVSGGAPAFVGPVIYAPGWYHPWVWEGGRYVYVPYRTYYWRHHGWHGGRDWRR
jgi:hypothetical protein